MCCGSQCGQCTGGIAYVMEKLASFAALTAVVVCIVVTLAAMLGLGVGLGYNYCFVDLRAFRTETDPIGERKPPGVLSNDDEDSANLRRSPASTVEPNKRTIPIPAIKHTISIPLNADFDFPTLLTKLRGRNRNVTLELIT